MSKEYGFQKVLAPFYQVSFGGKQLKGLEHRLIQEIQFEDSSSGADLLTITFQDPDFVILDSPDIVKATSVKFSGGFIFDHVEMFDGFISSVEVTFPEDGVTTVIVQCMDKSYLMDRIDRKETYKNMRHDQVATKVAQRNGMAIKTQSSGKVEEQITQSYKSDIQFLIDLADEIEWQCWVKGNTIYFLPPNYTQAPIKTYWWRRPPFNLISFSPRLVQADTKDGIDDQDIDPKNGKPTSDPAGKDTPVDRLGDKDKDSGGKNQVYDPHTGKWKAKGG